MSIGNWIAVRINDGWPSMSSMRAMSPIGNGMLEVLRFVVHFCPIHAHDPHEKQFDEAMPAEHQRREFLSCRSEHARRRTGS